MQSEQNETDESRTARLRASLFDDLFESADADPENGKIGEAHGSALDWDMGVPEI